MKKQSQLCVNLVKSLSANPSFGCNQTLSSRVNKLQSMFMLFGRHRRAAQIHTFYLRYIVCTLVCTSKESVVISLIRQFVVHTDLFMYISMVYLLLHLHFYAPVSLLNKFPVLTVISSAFRLNGYKIRVNQFCKLATFLSKRNAAKVLVNITDGISLFASKINEFYINKLRTF